MNIDIPDSIRSISIHQSPGTGRWYCTGWNRKDEVFHNQGASLFEAVFHFSEDVKHGRSQYAKNTATPPPVRDTSATPVATDIEGIELDI